MTPQERLDYLLEPVFVPTNVLVTIGEIKAALPAEAYGLVLATFAGAKVPASAAIADVAKAAEMESSFIAMSGDGLGLSTPDRQAVIDELALSGGWPDAVRDAVKALGGVDQPRWQVEGYQAEPTLADIEKGTIVSATRTAINAKATAINAWLDTVDLSAYTSVELQAYCDSLLDSADGNGGN